MDLTMARYRVATDARAPSLCNPDKHRYGFPGFADDWSNSSQVMSMPAPARTSRPSHRAPMPWKSRKKVPASVSFTPSRSQRAQANMALSTNGSAPPIHKTNPFRARTKELVQAAASAAFSHRIGAKMGQNWGEKLKGAMP